MTVIVVGHLLTLSMVAHRHVLTFLVILEHTDFTALVLYLCLGLLLLKRSFYSQGRTGTNCVAQVGLEVTAVLTIQSPVSWNFKRNHQAC